MIEEQLLEYINSGQCYVLVGSGPSCEMGYPSWKELAALAVRSVAERLGQERTDGYDKLIRQERFPDLFERARKDIGEASLLEILRSSLRPVAGKRGEIYSFLAKWPFAGYFTTNFDDEISQHLQKEGVYCRKLLNAPADFTSITGTARDFVVKLHGEIGSDRLVLWSSKYSELKTHDLGGYFRQKIEAIFSMFRVCIVGYGLRDPDIEYILDRAKQYSTPENPLFMMATGVSHREITELFDKYNIRIIPYPTALSVR